MTQLNPELFTSFQSALDALEQLSIIQDTTAAQKTTGTLDSVPVELKLRILHLSNLETCLALSESCDTYRRLWRSLDKELVREKVLRRVPWFQLNEGSTGLTTWDQCAKLLVARTRKSLEECDGWRLIKSTQSFLTENRVSHHRIDPTDVTFEAEARKKMNPMFANEIIYTATDQSLQGTKLRRADMTLELKTLVAQRGHSDVEEEEYSVVFTDTEVTAPSGLKLRHVDPDGEVGVANENDHLLHIRYTTDTPLEGPLDDDPRALIDGVIHKASHPRDPHGCLIIDPETLIMQQTPDQESMPLINLLPGDGGALIARFTYSLHVSCHLTYIEPTAELRHVILCAIPYPDYGGFDAFDHHYQPFCVFYNGFLYYLHEGRFMRLWVDLGYQKELKMSQWVRVRIGHDTLVQKTSTRALTAFNTLMPTVGTLALQQDLYGDHGIVQGDKNQAMDRFVTVRRASGVAVGDLLTGKTYFCKVPKTGYQTVIPYISNKKKKTVGFYSFSPLISYQLQNNLASLFKDNMPFMDLNGLYQHYLHMAEDFNINNISKYQPIVSRVDKKGKKDWYLHPRRVDDTVYAFKDFASEYTNIDGGNVELKFHPEKETDTEDWDCGKGHGREHEEYELDSDGEDDNSNDSDNGKSPAQLRAKYNGKLPSMHYKRGKRDGLRGKEDTRYDKQDYYKGYHEGYRARFGYTDPNDRDDYWGSNPKHGKWCL